MGEEEGFGGGGFGEEEDFGGGGSVSSSSGVRLLDLLCGVGGADFAFDASHRPSTRLDFHGFYSVSLVFQFCYIFIILNVYLV